MVSVANVCAKKPFGGGLFRPNSVPGRKSQGHTSTSRKSEPINQHDSDETTSGDDGEDTRKEKGKVRMDEEGSDKMAKNHDSDKSTSGDDGKKTKKKKKEGKVIMNEEGNDKMAKNHDFGKKTSGDDGKKTKKKKGKKETIVKDSETGLNTGLDKKRKRNDEEFRPGVFRPFSS